MKKSEVFGIFIVFLFLVPVISAVDTEIKIKTVPFGNININILEVGSLDSLERFNKDANNYGDASFVFSSDEPRFDITIYIKKNDKKIGYEQFKNNVAGESLYLEVVPEGFEIINAPVNKTEESNETLSNETIEPNETIVENITISETDLQLEQKGDSKLTGAAVFEEGGILSNKLLYYIIGLLILSMVVFMGVTKLKKRGQGPKEIKVKKLSEFKEEKKEKIGDFKDLIEDAEKKIKEAQEEIKKLKDNDKITQHEKKIAAAKKKLIEDQKELMRIREEKD